MSDCPACGMRDDDWFLCRRSDCAVKAPAAELVVDAAMVDRALAATDFAINRTSRAWMRRALTAARKGGE